MVDRTETTDLALVPPEADAVDGAAGYPTEFEASETVTVATEIQNREGSPIDYTMVVLLQDVEFDGDTSAVSTVRELDRSSLALDLGEARTVEYQYSAAVVDDDLRVTVLLHKDSVSPDPSAANASRAVHVSIAIDGTTTDAIPAIDRSSDGRNLAVDKPISEDSFEVVEMRTDGRFATHS